MNVIFLSFIGLSETCRAVLLRRVRSAAHDRIYAERRDDQPDQVTGRFGNDDLVDPAHLVLKIHAADCDDICQIAGWGVERQPVDPVAGRADCRLRLAAERRQCAHVV